jgi:hypothetical protein
MVEQLADSMLFVSLCRDRRGHYPFVFISFISREAEELKQNLLPNHMVRGNTRFFKSLTATLDEVLRASTSDTIRVSDPKYASGLAAFYSATSKFVALDGTRANQYMPHSRLQVR